MPLLNNPAAAWNHPAFTGTKVGNDVFWAVRDGQWRYAEYRDGKAMLIDEVADSRATKNLASDPALADMVKQMKALLSQIPE